MHQTPPILPHPLAPHPTYYLVPLFVCDVLTNWNHICPRGWNLGLSCTHFTHSTIPATCISGATPTITMKRMVNYLREHLMNGGSGRGKGRKCMYVLCLCDSLSWISVRFSFVATFRTISCAEATECANAAFASHPRVFTGITHFDKLVFFVVFATIIWRVVIIIV